MSLDNIVRLVFILSWKSKRESGKKYSIPIPFFSKYLCGSVSQVNPNSCSCSLNFFPITTLNSYQGAFILYTISSQRPCKIVNSLCKGAQMIQFKSSYNKSINIHFFAYDNILEYCNRKRNCCVDETNPEIVSSK